LILATACLTAALGVRAAEIVIVAPLPVSAGTALLRAQRVGAAGDAVERPVALPGTAKVTLPAGLFEIRLTAPNVWAAPVHLTNDETVTMNVWPTVPLSGSSNGAKTLRVQFTALASDRPSGEVSCQTDGDRWACNIPAGRYDLRFLSSGSAPEFRFAALVPQPPIRLEFVRGASLSGKVEAVSRMNVALTDAEVFLTPASGDASPAKQTTRASVKGLFQFKGLLPGDYTVHAVSRGLATRAVPVKIVAGLNAELTAPLLLDRPRRVTVTVMPRVDPAGKPWKVQLLSTNKRLRQFEVVSESAVSPSGQWTHPRLFAGDYTVVLSTSTGGRWKSEDVTVDRDDVSVVIAGLAARIRGEITLGERPLKAALSFGGEWGIKLESDDEGRFEGEIPLEENDERVVLVDADSPTVRRTIRAKIERDGDGLHARIELPATTLMGRVRNADGSPEPHAIVAMTRSDSDVFEQTFAQSDGSFQIAGLAPGDYEVTADGFQKSSRSLPVELRLDQTAEVELVLEHQEHVQGRMTVGDAPVIAAQVWALPRDAWAPAVPSARTDESGHFEMDLPPGTTTFDGVAVHPAFDIILGRTVIQKDKQMHIRAQQVGGTLNIESDSKAALLVMHNGGEFSANWLAGLAGGSVASGRLSIPRLQPGQYSVCTPKDKKCTSGYLAPHGTLTLTLAAN
jgi:hypothetical protein